jgi:hypothetical protein
VDTWACLFGDLVRRKSAWRRHASRPAGDMHHNAQTQAIAFHGLKRAIVSKVVPDIRPKIAVGRRLGGADDVLSPLLPNGVAKNENNSG